MLRRSPDLGRKAQVFLEYTIIISVVILVLTAMSTLIKRGTQGMIKVVADQIGTQINSEQNFNEGYLDSSYTTVSATADKVTQEFVGDTSYIYGDITSMHSVAIINLGFTED